MLRYEKEESEDEDDGTGREGDWVVFGVPPPLEKKTCLEEGDI